ncbi:IMP dehydrogenase [Erysipelothrix sp. HDW6C]|uniref:IMP dehydrogenase n=1 Tax=Erysipelothrix sp. HDW6C TaxID=2714930 RepID=UPI00140825F4|nr:IMP dehydrogenase [Erysipelothrix sp. HDW6C]QIK70378.1 IMP dehydrogenase [Erysipelothrix sp. HDW6C]
MDTKNSRQFVDGFVKIEMYLKDYLDTPNVGFAQMVHMAAKTHKVVARYINELTEFGQLRNAIVHNRAGNNEAIAEPHDSVIQSMDHILGELEKPKTFKDVLPLDGVYSTVADRLLSDVLKDQKQYNYSAVPVYEDKRYVGLLHNRLYQRLLENYAFKSLDLRTLRVSDVLEFYENDDRVLFLPETTTLYDAIATYNKLHENGKVMIAMVITTRGFVNEKPLGILTIADMPKLISELE